MSDLPLVTGGTHTYCISRGKWILSQLVLTWMSGLGGFKGGYDYIGTHTNAVLVLDVDPTSIFNKLKETYTIKAFVPPKFRLGCEYAQVKKGATTRLVMGISTYITECLRKV